MNGTNAGMVQTVAHIPHTAARTTAPVSVPSRLPVRNLQPGELHIGPTPAIVRTVLGSCVAVTMFHRRCRIAAICHAMLPYPVDRKPYPFDYAENRKYVTYVVPEMVSTMRLKYDIDPRKLEVKLFGGSDTYNQGAETEYESVGMLNIQSALQALKKEHLALSTYDVGGRRGRSLRFNTHTGEVLLKRVRSLAAA